MQHRAIFLSIESIRRPYRSFRSVRARPGFEKSSTENCACHSYRGCDSNDASSDWQPRASHKTGTQRALDSLVCNVFTLSDRQANNLALLSVKQIRNKGAQLILYKALATSNFIIFFRVGILEWLNIKFKLDDAFLRNEKDGDRRKNESFLSQFYRFFFFFYYRFHFTCKRLEFRISK